MARSPQAATIAEAEEDDSASGSLTKKLDVRLPSLADTPTPLRKLKPEQPNTDHAHLSLQQKAPAAESDGSLGPLPSIGSDNHELGTCKRCCFFPKGRCTNGYDCEFCHYDHAKRIRKKKRRRSVGLETLQLEHEYSSAAEEETPSHAGDDADEEGTPSHAGDDAEEAPSAHSSQAESGVVTQPVSPGNFAMGCEASHATFMFPAANHWHNVNTTSEAPPAQVYGAPGVQPWLTLHAGQIVACADASSEVCAAASCPSQVYSSQKAQQWSGPCMAWLVDGPGNGYAGHWIEAAPPYQSHQASPYGTLISPGLPPPR